MPLTKEQLLQKRFKFILPFPGAHWRIGGIFELVGDDLYAVSGLPIKMLGCILEEYPHIFQPLPWWSDRNVDDMPKYVKWLCGPHVKEIQIAKFDFETDTLYLNNCQSTLNMWIDSLEPCDETEYNAYINQKQQ